MGRMPRHTSKSHPIPPDDPRRRRRLALWTALAMTALCVGCPSDGLFNTQDTPEVNCAEQCPCDCRDDNTAPRRDSSRDKKTRDKRDDKRRGDKVRDDDKLELPSKNKAQTPYAVFLAGNVVIVEGDLQREEAKRLIASERADLQSCYKSRLRKNPDLKAELTVQFTASTRTGEVIAAVVRQSNIKNTGLTRCLTRKIRAWTFKAREDTGAESVVRFDLVMLGVTFDKP